MKRVFILLFGMVLFGCSSDDNSGGTNDNDTVNFLPQQQGNYWVYDVDSDEFNGRDSLYVSGTTASGVNIYYTYSTSEPPFGFYSGLMTEGTTRTSGSKILMNGSLEFGDLFGEEFDLGIALEDFVIFDGNASQGQTLDSETGSFTVPYGEEVDLQIEYTLSSTTGQSYSDYSLSNGESYQNVKSVSVAVSAKITANVVISGFPLSFTILDTQDVINSTQYYASNIGVIYSETDFQYQLNDIPLPDIELPLPQSYQSNIKEVLDDYSVE